MIDEGWLVALLPIIHGEGALQMNDVAGQQAAVPRGAQIENVLPHHLMNE